MYPAYLHVVLWLCCCMRALLMLLLNPCDAELHSMGVDVVHTMMEHEC